MSRKEGFLDRWSRLKEEGQPSGAPTPVEAPPDPPPVTPPEADERTDEEILAELGLPDPDDLTLGDDFTGFMSKAVPDRLRRRALRQLWRANPVLANVDGLVEYGEDYTDSAMVVENLQTLYQVGKGMFVETEEPDEPEEVNAPGAEGASDVAAPAAAAETEAETEAETVDMVETAQSEMVIDESQAAPRRDDQPDGEDDDGAPFQPTLKRMTFS